MSEVAIVRDPDEGGELVASIIAELVAEKPDAVLGIATGSSPESTYRALARRGLDLGQISAFGLDEYLGLPEGHPASYASVIERDVVGPLGLDPRRVHVPGRDGLAAEGAGERYERDIAASGGIDLQLLGIGRTGHLGFNEPGSSLASRTRIAVLTEQTRVDNARFFGSPDEVPTQCITQGIGTIRRARRLVLLAFGADKAQILAAAVEGPVTSRVPGSAIQLHEWVTVIADEAAAARLEYARYHRVAPGRFSGAARA